MADPKGKKETEQPAAKPAQLGIRLRGRSLE